MTHAFDCIQGLNLGKHESAKLFFHQVKHVGYFQYNGTHSETLASYHISSIIYHLL